jgi:hypothetical protein
MIVKRIDMGEVNNRIAVNLGRVGFSARYIAQQTHMSPAQVYARLKVAEVRLRAYRNGETEVATVISSRIQETVVKRLADVRIRLRPLLLRSAKK